MRQILRISISLAVLVGVFCLGLFCGRSHKPVPSAPVSAVSVEPGDGELSEAERRMAKALDDPEFRRVHDHLMRDNPVQLNVPPLPGPAPEKPVVPMSERPPVRFNLNE